MEWFNGLIHWIDHLIQWVDALVHQHPNFYYLLTFVGTFFEGETFVFFVGFLAAQGTLNAPLVLSSAWLGSFAGDQCWFWIGRRFGLRVLARRPVWRARVDKALVWLNRFETGFILIFRFIYGIRNISSFTLGISGIGWRRFMALNFIAAGLWAVTFVGAGYLFGDAFGHAAANRIETAVLIAVVAAAVIAWLIYRFRRRRPQREIVIPESR